MKGSERVHEGAQDAGAALRAVHPCSAPSSVCTALLLPAAPAQSEEEEPPLHDTKKPAEEREEMVVVKKEEREPLRRRLCWGICRCSRARKDFRREGSPFSLSAVVWQHEHSGDTRTEIEERAVPFRA